MPARSPAPWRPTKSPSAPGIRTVERVGEDKGTGNTGIQCRGDFYAARCIRALGLAERGGVVRASMVHYNTAEEVERLIRALDAAIPA